MLFFYKKVGDFMIDFILNILAVIVALELRQFIIKLFKIYKLNIIKKNITSEMFETLNRSDFL